MQYGESDLAFISRLTGRCGHLVSLHPRRALEHRRGRVLRSTSAITSSTSSCPTARNPGSAAAGRTACGHLQSSHQVVEQQVNIRAYHHRDASAHLNGEIDQSRGASGTYGEAYHYAEPYTRPRRPAAIKTKTCQRKRLLLRTPAPRAVPQRPDPTRAASAAAPPWRRARSCRITGGAPQAFTAGAVITRLTTQRRPRSQLRSHLRGHTLFRNRCAFARHCTPNPKSPAPSRPASPAHRPTTLTATSTSKAATRSTSCSTATPGNPAKKASGCAWPGPTPATPTACTCH